MSDVINPILNTTYSSYVIAADDSVETKVVVVSKIATSEFIREALAGLLANTIKELAAARAEVHRDLHIFRQD